MKLLYKWSLPNNQGGGMKLHIWFIINPKWLSYLVLLAISVGCRHVEVCILDLSWTGMDCILTSIRNHIPYHLLALVLLQKLPPPCFNQFQQYGYFWDTWYIINHFITHFITYHCITNFFWIRILETPTISQILTRIYSSVQYYWRMLEF